MHPHDFSEQLIDLVNEKKQDLACDIVESITVLAQAGEWEIGFEILCNQLDEYDVMISESYYKKIVLFGSLIQISPSHWEFLRRLVKDESGLNL